MTLDGSRLRDSTPHEYNYRIHSNKSRAHINAWALINAGVQHSKAANRRLAI